MAVPHCSNRSKEMCFVCNYKFFLDIIIQPIFKTHIFFMSIV